jgi:hypothetical protein
MNSEADFIKLSNRIMPYETTRCSALTNQMLQRSFQNIFKLGTVDL